MLDTSNNVMIECTRFIPTVQSGTSEIGTLHKGRYGIGIGLGGDCRVFDAPILDVVGVDSKKLVPDLLDSARHLKHFAAREGLYIPLRIVKRFVYRQVRGIDPSWHRLGKS